MPELPCSAWDSVQEDDEEEDERDKSALFFLRGGRLVPWRIISFIVYRFDRFGPIVMSDPEEESSFREGARLEIWIPTGSLLGSDD